MCCCSGCLERVLRETATGGVEVLSTLCRSGEEKVRGEGGRGGGGRGEGGREGRREGVGREGGGG